MGCCRIAGLLVLVLGVGLAYFWHTLDSDTETIELPDTYWGPGTPKPDDPAIKPFKINVPDAVLEDLKRRLDNTRAFAPTLEGMNFQYGMNAEYLNSMISYWKKDYKWRERETYLNKYPQFKTQVSGLNIHFIHAKPDKTKLRPGQTILPLLLLHGWPGSVREFYEILPLLITPRAEEKFVFEVIAPSLPGYGFSEPASKPGLGYAHVAVVMKKLMNKLGYEKFYIQGGDWGSAIGASLSGLYPQSVLGYHTNMCMPNSRKVQIKLFLSTFLPWLFAEEGKFEHLSQQPAHLLEESGYMHIQATKPDTVGVGLTDSPAGLAAYILEKFSTWTNPSWKQKSDGGLSHFNKATLLDNVMIYWVTGSITTSMRLYSESFSRKNYYHPVMRSPINVPTGCARFVNEVMYLPRSFITAGYPQLVRFTDMPKGGHFAALEVPDLLAEDVWQFVATVLSNAEKVKKEKEKKTEM